MMSSVEEKQAEAFDNLTEEIQRYARYEMRPKTEICSCCTKEAVDFLRIYLCDRHMKKYGEIKSI